MDGTIRLWNASTGQLRKTLSGQKAKVFSVAFSPDGDTLASGGGRDDPTVRLWDVRTGQHLHAFDGHVSGVNSLAFSPDGETLASSGGWFAIWDNWNDSTIRLWNVRTGQNLKTIKNHTGEVISLAFSPDGRTLASGSMDATVRLWYLRNGQYLRRSLEGHTGFVSSVMFSPDGGTLASSGGSKDSTIRRWGARNGRHQQTLKVDVDLFCYVAFSPDGRTLASSGGVFLSNRGWSDSTIRLWDAGNGRHQHTLEGHTDEVSFVGFSPDGSTLASGSRDNTIRLWNANTGEHLQTLNGHKSPVYTVGFSPDGNTLASGSWDRTVRLWNASTGQFRQTLEGHMGAVYTVAFSHDGGTLASGSGDYTIRLWNANTGEHQRTLEGHMGAVNAVAFSPDRRTFASGSYDGTVLLWDLRRTTTWGDIKRTAVVDGAMQPLEFSPSVLDLTATETALLANYPNPFNPETWIPYQLGKPADVVLTIYDMKGERVRRLAAGHQPAGVYHSRSRAAYWDGRNQQGEFVSSGLYFCTLSADSFTATRKMLVGK